MEAVADSATRIPESLDRVITCAVRRGEITIAQLEAIVARLKAKQRKETTR